jgi:hypothetical protein
MAVNDKPKNKPAARDVRSSRTKAGINVIISIVSAAALLVVANVIANTAIPNQRLRWNIETLGRYGLSESAKRILDQVRQPAQVTVAYRSTEPDKKPDEYLPALRDLLEEMHQYKPNLTAVIVNSDRGLAQLMDRVRKNMNEAAKDHQNVVSEFQIFCEQQLPLYERVAQEWKSYPAKGWLSLFNVPLTVEKSMNESRDELRKASTQIRNDLGGSSLPDYPAMTGQIAQTLKRIKEERLDPIPTTLRELAKLPDKTQKLSPELIVALDAFTAAINKASAVMKPDAADPADALAKFAAATREISDSAEKAVKILGELESGALRVSTCWEMEVDTQQGPAKAELPEVYQQLGGIVMTWGEQAQGVRANANADAQKKFIGNVAAAMPRLTLQARKARTAVEEMLAMIGKIDDATKQRFEEAKSADYLSDLIKPVVQLQEQLAKLPQLADQSELVERIKQDNFILIEMDNKLAVVAFDDVWPLGSRREMMDLDNKEQDKREFYGDMAIGSKLLSMVSKPFAEVVLTYFEVVPPQQYWSQVPPVVGPIYSQQLSTLKERLAKANVSVAEWNLAKEEAPPKPKEDAKQVLLVLPTPEPTPPMGPMDQGGKNQFTPEQAAKVAAVIDAGAPAIFLAGYVRPRGGPFGPPMPMTYGWDEYLSKNWGVEVREEARVIQTVRDPVEPDKFQLPVLRWDFMPLSTFTDHPIGKPLRARRFYWLSTCPVGKAATPAADVAIRDLLVAPKGMEGIWATTEPERMWRDIIAGRGTGIVPNKQADIMPPFALAVEATKKTDKGANSIVVLGVGLSYIDNFLTTRIPQLKGGDTLTTEPPPAGDIDLLVNSVYYVVGKGEYIGAGPAVAQPIGLIDASRMSLIRGVFGLGWPALVLVVGLAVTWTRRR